MLGALSCESQRLFDGVCRFISGHDPTGFAGPVVQRLIGAIAIFLIVYLAGRVARRLTEGALHRAAADRQVRTLVHNVMAAVTFTAAVLCALVVAGVPFTAVLTTAGIGSIAIGLAFQDLLRNILAGMWLLLEHPFRLGDNVAVLDQAGVVQNITLRTTTLRTADGRLAVLPNLTMFSNPVLNASTFQLRQFTVSVREPDGIDLERVLREARTALQSVSGVSAQPSPSVVPQVDGEAVLIHCRYWVDQNAQDPDSVATEITRRLWAQRQDAGQESAR